MRAKGGGDNLEKGNLAILLQNSTKEVLNVAELREPMLCSGMQIKRLDISVNKIKLREQAKVKQLSMWELQT